MMSTVIKNLMKAILNQAVKIKKEDIGLREEMEVKIKTKKIKI